MDRVATYMDEQRYPPNPELKQFNEEYEDFMFAPTREKYINIKNTYKELPDHLREIDTKMYRVRAKAKERGMMKTISGGSRRRRNISSRFKKSRKSGRKSGRKSVRRHNKKSSRRYRR